MLCCAADAGLLKRHSPTSQLAAGDFDGDGRADAVWILPNGDLRLYSPSLNFGGTVPGTAAFAVVGADITSGGDAFDEVVYLKQVNPSPSGFQEIRAISVPMASDTLLPGASVGTSRLTAGDWDNDGDDGYVVLGAANLMYGSEPTPGGIVYTSPGGAGPAMVGYVGGDFVPGRPGQEYASFDTTALAYVYNGGASNAHTYIAGSGLNAISGGNVTTAAAGDEVFATVGTALWQWRNGIGWQNLPGGGSVPGAGNTHASSGGLDEWYIIGASPYPLYRYAGNSAWALAGNSTVTNRLWQDYVAADYDGDGLDEIVAIKRDTGAAFYNDPQTSDRFQRITAFDAAPSMPVETGLRLWLDASDASTVVNGAGGVQTWMDKSGNNFHATQANASQQPALNATALNGRPAVRFDGADDGLVIDDGLSLGRPYTVFTVDQYYGTPAGRTLQGRDANWLTGKWGGNNAYFAGSFVYNSAAALNVAAIGDAQGYGNSSAYSLNGIDVTQSPSATGVPGRLGLVGGGLHNEQGRADVAEVIVFDRALSFHERSQVGLYLREKYGQTGYTAYNTHLATREWAFTGADPGEGLDFQGKFAYAVNARGPGGIQIGDAAFTSDAGLISSEHEILSFTTTNYGPSAADANLGAVMQSIRWTATGDGGQENLTVALPNLEVGRTYKLQMLFADNWANRHFAVDINGSRVVGDLQAAGIQGGTNIQGAVLVHQFVATSPTMNIALDGAPTPAGGDRSPILNGLTLEDLGVTGKTWTSTFTGGDPGEGLNMSMPFQYAVNVGGPGGFRIGNTLFTADSATPGFHINAESAAANWSPSNFGSSSSDDSLEQLMTSIRWSAVANGAGVPARGEALSIDLDGLEIGQQYLLGLFFQEACCGRGFDVVINDTLVADEFSPVGITGGVNPGMGVLLSHQFYATDETLHIVLDGYPASFSDRNPILQGLTLAQIPEPATWLLLTLGGALVIAAARRRPSAARP